METKKVVKLTNHQEFSELLKKATNQVEQLSRTLEQIENFKPKVIVD
ncbi:MULTISPECIES: hypothetical protein [Bacillus]|nr:MULTISPECIES: hypothetical protein [Bacillus]MBU8787095.1 hypothetical protein [Bacillus glycinifermentans]MDU0070080.1 hypothetical protein [Bacillus sp. IG6]MED8017753.1 hypothetical protein [Bacillus glycinifermentans]WKB76138.1 hypothetical protein QYM22_17255 [Bacillus glycinifermentans]SCA87190.1 hypothetical protein BGLY_3367 [Bacillus glycinifermentans]